MACATPHKVYVIDGVHKWWFTMNGSYEGPHTLRTSSMERNGRIVASCIIHVQTFYVAWQIQTMSCG